MNAYLDYADVLLRNGMVLVRLGKSLWVRSDGREFASVYAADRG